MAFVDSGPVRNVLPKTLFDEFRLEMTTTSRCAIGFKDAKGSHIKHHGQRCFRVKTRAERTMNTTWEVADVRKPLISASRLLERRQKLVLDEKPRIPCETGDVIDLEGCGSLFAVRLWILERFLRHG